MTNSPEEYRNSTAYSIVFGVKIATYLRNVKK